MNPAAGRAPRILDTIDGPGALRGMTAGQLVGLAAEIRAVLVDTVRRRGGHLGPNLGVVELTIALHRVFDSPADALVFDTGHQSYVHKILTGRRPEFETLRQPGGLSGYPSRAESPHDVIENSHASTALSYADGLARAAQLTGQAARRVVAIVGDGALGGGMAWEALNNIGAAQDRPVIVVVNDNGRSYAPTVGAMARHLAELSPGTGGVRPRSLFEQLGLAYIGPVDGHDIAAVEAALREAAALWRPVAVHCRTVKGKGYPPAETDPVDCLHAVEAADPATGKPPVHTTPSWTSVFAGEIAAIGAERPDVVCLSAGMVHPVGLGRFAECFPERTIDVGIAEQHAMTCAAGLALGGLHPVVAIYSTFLGRAWDQLLTDVALHRLPVTVVTDRSGITGPDGPSHHGVWEASILPVVPGLRIAAPRDGTLLAELLREAVDFDGPSVVRFPKGPVSPRQPALRRAGSIDLLREDPGAEVLLVGVGPEAAACLAAAGELAGRGVPSTVVDPRWIAPLDDALLELASCHRLVLAVEDTATTGALGGRIAQALAAVGSPTSAATFALPPAFLPHGPRDELLRAHGLDPAGITTTVLKRLARR